MEISFFKPQDFEGNLKATIHITGKLGFTDAAIKKIGINERKGIKIGRNTNDNADRNLYAVFVDDVNEDAFKINKAGAYYYVNTKALFDTMNIDYVRKRISFDIIPAEAPAGFKYYKFVYKEKTKYDEKEEKSESE